MTTSRTCGSVTSGSRRRSRTAASRPSRERSAPTATWRREQARGAPPEPSQDLYAVGRVGLELVTGLPPARQLEVPSHPLRPLLERLLVADPEQRLATADGALRLLRRLPVPPSRCPPVPDRLGAPPRQRRTRTGPAATDLQEVDWPGWCAVATLLAVVVGCLCVLLGWTP